MEKKSKRKNDLKSSIIILLLLVLLLISSTYAWFTANQTVTIDTLDVKIEAQNGLQISTDGTTWKSLIEKADITDNAYSGNNNQVPSTMEPVSTVGEIDESTGNMLMYYGTVAPDEDDGGTYKLTAELEPEDGGKFVAFDIFLKADSDVQLQLTTNSGVVKKGSDNGIKQAARVAFVKQGTVAAGSDVADIIALKDATSFGESGSTVYIWEPNSNWHTKAAVAHANDNYKITTTESTNGTSVAAVPYYGVNSEIDTGVALVDTNNGNNASFTKITPDYVTESDADGALTASKEIFSITAGITKLRIYMWVEGQDVDCENTASGTDISFNVQLQVVGSDTGS